MALVSSSFKRLVAALKDSKKTCTVVEQCCGGLISASIMAQPGASSVFIGGSVAYNTRRAKKLLLDDDELHASLATIGTATETGESAAAAAEAESSAKHVNETEGDVYMRSKLDWTAKTSVAFCKAIGTDFAIAEGGASGPTFRPRGMETGFAAVTIAGRTPDGKIQVIRQELVKSDHANRQGNMRLFADKAADIATEMVTNFTQIPYLEAISPGCDQRNTKAFELDRATHLRNHENGLAKLEQDPRYVILKGNKCLVHDDSMDLVLMSQEQVQSLEMTKDQKTFLGLITENQTPVFGIDILDDVDVDAEQTSFPPGMSFVDTRTTAPLFSPLHNKLSLQATAYAQWQRRSTFCTLCGGQTILVESGTSRRCTSCNAPSWPRQDPSIIVAVSSRCGNRVLLANSNRHPPKVHSVLAGFVEAGETFEDAVAREAFEETGVRIDEGSVKYVGSQPWPFPQSCMIGFTAVADDTAPLQVDTNEIASARWFHTSEVLAATKVEGLTMQREVAAAALEKDPSLPLLIPPKGVIARKLIDEWLSSG